MPNVYRAQVEFRGADTERVKQWLHGATRLCHAPIVVNGQASLLGQVEAPPVHDQLRRSPGHDDVTPDARAPVVGGHRVRVDGHHVAIASLERLTQMCCN